MIRSVDKIASETGREKLRYWASAAFDKKRIGYSEYNAIMDLSTAGDLMHSHLRELIYELINAPDMDDVEGP